MVTVFHDGGSCQRKERSSNFELLRIVSILFILLMHTYSQGHGSTPFSFTNNVLGYLICEIGNTGVSCFILIAGYFGVKFKMYRFVQLCLLTTFYILIVYFFNKGFVCNLKFVKLFLVVPMYGNWFISCYLILMLMSKYINQVCDSLSQKDFIGMLLISFVLFNLLPTIFSTGNKTVITGGGKCLLYFIYIYMIGRYIRLYGPDHVSPKKSVLGIALMVLIMFVLELSVSMYTHRQFHVLSRDCSFFILIEAVLFFYLFKSFRVQSKCINYLASSVLAVFLLDGIRFWLNRYVQLSSYANDNMFIVMLLLLVFGTFTFNILLDKIRILLFGHVEYQLINLMMRCFARIKKRVETKYYSR
jgi:surface polysaccharide O-acyltransferase-like enzyme